MLQTLHGAIITPVGSVIPITKEDVLRQAAITLDPIVSSLLAAGLDYDDVVEVWSRSVRFHRRDAARDAAHAAD